MRFFSFVSLTMLTLSSGGAALAQGAGVTCGQTYIVTSGDTLSSISTRAYGASMFEVLYQANRAAIGDDPNRLFVGQELAVPCRDGGGTAQAASAPEAEAPEAEAEIIQASVTQDSTTEPRMPVVVRFNKTSDPRFVLNVGIIDPYLAAIEAATEGRVVFVDPPEVSMDEQAQLDLVRSGVFDAAYVFNGYLADTHPLLQVPMMPNMGGSAQQTAVALWNLHEDYLSKTNYFDDAHVLGFVAAPAAHIWRPIDEPVEVSDVILDQNVYSVPYFLGLDTIGPQKVQERNAEMYGGIDEDADGPLTFMMAHGAARGGGIWNPTRAVTEVENGIYTPTLSVVISNETWDRISPQDQEIISDLSGLAFSQRSAAWDDFDNFHRGFMLENGLAVTYPTPEVAAYLEASLQDRLARWSRTAENLGVPAAEAIAAYRADLVSLQYLLIFK